MRLKIIHLLATITAVSTAGSAAAKTLICQSAGFCTNELKCTASDDKLQVRDLPGDRVEFGWIDAEARFVGTPSRHEGFTLYFAGDKASAVQMLSIADDMTATMSIVTVIFDELYHSIQALTCEELRK